MAGNKRIIMAAPKIVHIKEKSLRAKLALAKLGKGGVAMVMRKTIYLYGVSKENFLSDPKWLCHELQHVKQYEQQGVFLFLIKYIFYWIRHGYYNIPFEVEARANENNLSLLNEYVIL